MGRKLDIFSIIYHMSVNPLQYVQPCGIYILRSMWRICLQTSWPEDCVSHVFPAQVYVPFITYPRPLNRRRVFILGPSHHVYLAGCALSSTTHYETPLYNLEIDQMSTWQRARWSPSCATSKEAIFIKLLAGGHADNSCKVSPCTLWMQCRG